MGVCVFVIITLPSTATYVCVYIYVAILTPLNVKEKCFCASNQAWAYLWACVCVCVIIKQISSSQLLVCVCVCMKCSWECYKRSAPRCVSVCAHVRSRVGMGVCMCAYVCVCNHHSPVDSFLCVYVSICMLTPLNDCDYIRQYFTDNYEVLCIINGIVFPHNYIMQPSQQPTERKKMPSAFT